MMAAVRDAARDDLVALMEAQADHTNENGHVLIDVQVAVDIAADHPVLVASVRPEPTESTQPTKEGESN